MDVRASRFTRISRPSNDFTSLNRLSGFHADGIQVAINARHAITVADRHTLSVTFVVIFFVLPACILGDYARAGGSNRRIDWNGYVHAVMGRRLARFGILASSVGRRDVSRCRRSFME
jgi:hypothetical protein